MTGYIEWNIHIALQILDSHTKKSYLKVHICQIIFSYDKMNNI